LISSTVTPLLSAPLTCSLISGGPVQGSEHRQVHQAAGLSVECSIPPSPCPGCGRPLEDIMNSSAPAVEASTYSGPRTSRRIGMPFWNKASSSDILSLSLSSCRIPAPPVSHRPIRRPILLQGQLLITASEACCHPRSPKRLGHRVASSRYGIASA